MTNAELDSMILSTAARPRMEKIHHAVFCWHSPGQPSLYREIVNAIPDTGTKVRLQRRIFALTRYGRGCKWPSPLKYTNRWGWRPR